MHLGSLSHLSLPKASSNFVELAEKDLARAEAYANFIVNKNHKNLKIEKGTNFSIDSNGYIGPFKLTFTKTNGTFRGKNGTENAFYGYIKKLHIKGSNTALTLYKNTSGTKYSYSNVDSGSLIYIKKSDVSESGTSLTLVAEQEGGINADYTIFHSTVTSGYTSTINPDIQLLEEDNGLYCQYCTEVHTQINNDINTCIICGSKLSLNNCPNGHGTTNRE